MGKLQNALIAAAMVSGNNSGGGGGGGTTNYNALSNKPSIGGTTLSGDKPLGKFGDLQDFFDENATQAVSLSATPKITMASGQNNSEFSSETAKVVNGADSVTVTKDTVEVKSGTDIATVKKNEVKVTDGTDTFTATPLKAEASDGTDTAHLKKNEVKVADADESFTATKAQMEIKSGNDSVTATKDTVTVKNGSDIATIKKNEIKTTDGTDAMTATPLKVEVKDADETTTVAKDSVEVKKGAVTTKIEDDRASMTDGTHTIAMSPVKATYGEHLKLGGDGVLESWEKVLGVGNFAVIEKTTVSKEYAVGSYLLSGGTMYRVTKAIASGGAIVTTGENANVEAKRVDEVIAELTAKDTAQDTEIAALANSGAKNIFPRLSSATANGITATVNDDGSVTVNGTSTSVAQFTTGYYVIPKGKYILSSGVSADKLGDVYTFVNAGSASGSFVKGLINTFQEDNKPVTVDYNGYAKVLLGIYVPTNKTLDNVTVYPMLRDAAITDDTYVPYAMSNAELTAKKQDVGDYVLNGGATGYADFKFSKSAHVQNMRRGNNQYSNGLSILGENSKADLDGVIREWLRYERHTGQLQGYIYKEGASSWEAVHSWQADEDTGWQTLETDTTKWTGGELRYRKKNGIVFVTMNDGKPATNITGGQYIQIATLPTGSRPTWASQYGALWLRTASGNIPCEFVVAPAGTVFVRPSQAVTATNITSSYGTVSFPV